MTWDSGFEVENQRRPLLSETNANDTSPSPFLPLSLRVLFAFNGITLALPMTAMLYLVNTRVMMPLQLMPSYAAVAFLPCSLKPAYAYTSSLVSLPRHVQIAVLLTLSGAACAATAFIPKHAVVTCFFLAFMRSFFASWPEFLLGLTLIDYAVAHEKRQPGQESYAVTSALLQSQAATARSAGSTVAHFFVLAFFGVLRFTQATDHEFETELLNDTTVAILFLVTAALNLTGAVIAWNCRIGNIAVNDECRGANANQPPSRTPPFDSTSDCSDPLEARSSVSKIEMPGPLLLIDVAAEQQDGHASHPNANIWLVVLLQIAAVLFTMRQPVVHATSSLGWILMASATIIALLAVGCWTVTGSYGVWKLQHHVGLFLILRNAVPSVSYLMSSYFYTVFARSPSFLQLLSFLDMCISTAACWTFGKFLSKYSRNQQLLYLVAGTTALAAAASSMNVTLIQVLDPEKSHFSITAKVAMTIVVRAVVGFTSEWKFLPDVVLATVSVNALESPISTGSRARSTDGLPRPSFTDEQGLHEQRQQSASVGLQYGTLISCIDFGGQLGALLAGPLVALLGTTRDNDWAHLDWLQEINSTMMLLSIAFLFILVRK